MIKSLLLSIYLTILFFSLQAQNVRYITYNSRNNELSNNLTKAVSQDSLGFIWVATDDGLSRFDGVVFQNFIKGLPSNYVKALLKTSNGALYASTDMGIVKITSRPDTAFFSTIIKGSNQLTDSTVNYPKLMMEDSRGNIWITDNQGILLYKSNKLKRYTFNKTFKTVNYQRTFSIAETLNGNLFAFSPDGFTFYLDRKADQYVEVKDITQFKGVNFAIATRDNSILLATSLGIYELSTGANNKVIGLKNLFPSIDGSYIAKKSEDEFIVSTWFNNVYTITKKNKKYEARRFSNLSAQRSNWLHVDNYKNIFVSTDEGVVMIQNTQFLPETNKIYKNYINSMCLLPGNEIWAINYGSILKIKYENDSIITKEIPHPDLSGNISAAAPSKIKKNSYWLSTNTAILYFIADNKIEKTIDISDIGKNIFNCMEDNEQNLWGCVDGFNGVVKFSKNFERTLYDAKKGVGKRFIVVKQRKDGEIFGGACTDNDYLYQYDKKSDRFVNESKKLSFSTNNNLYINDIAFQDNIVWLATTNGVLKYDGAKAERLDLGEFTERNVFSIEADRKGSIWFANGKSILKYVKNQAVSFDENNGLSNLTATYRCFVIDSLNRLWIGTSLGVNFSKNADETRCTPTPVVSQVFVNKEKIENVKAAITFTKGSYLTIDFFTLSFPGNEIIYQYKLSGESDKWIDQQSKTELILPDVTVGKHILQIRAKQQGNYYWSLSYKLELDVIRPWFSRWWAFIFYAIAFTLIVYSIVRINSYRLTKQKELLKKIVKERTIELERQKAEIEENQQKIKEQYEELQSVEEELRQNNEELLITLENNEIQKQQLEIFNSELTKSNEKIEIAHNEILAGINYAKTIQQALLTSKELIDSFLKKYFILFRPKNNVSGDFYYVNEIGNKIIIAVADCTGHGVAGGLLTMLGITYLHEAIRDDKMQFPSEILNHLRERFKRTFKEFGSNSNNGLDIALCFIDKTSNNMQFAGANSPVWICRAGEIIELQPTKNPIGYYPKEVEFTSQEFQLQAEDNVYLFSDGFKDQLGGKQNEKYKSKRFRELILSLSTLSMDEQKQKMDEDFTDWKSNFVQTDDILVLGFQVNG